MLLKIPRFSFSTLFLLVPIYYFNSCTAEFFKHYSFFLPLVAFFGVMWFASLIAEKYVAYVIEYKHILPMIFFAGVLVLLLILGFGDRISVLSSNFSNVIFILLFEIILVVYSGEDKKNDRRIIIFFWFADTVVSCIYSIYRLTKEPFLARLLSTGSYHQTAEAESARGVISFGVVYGLIMVLLVLSYLAINEKKNRFVRIFLIALFLYAIFIAQFTIAIILTAIGVIMILISNNLTKDNVQFRVLIALLISIPILIFLPFILQFFVRSGLFGYEVTVRIEEILVLLRGEELTGTDMILRFAQYNRSVFAFFSSFGLGKIVFDSVNPGTHSEILDGFANYGLLFLVFLFALVSVFRYVKKILPNKKAVHIYKVVFFVYIMMGILNTSIWAPMTLMLLVIVPFMCLDEIDGGVVEPQISAG